MKTINYIPAARFATLAARAHTRMAKGSKLIVTSDAPHPESGETNAVELKFDGEFYLVDGLLMANRKRFDTRYGNISTVTGAMPWKEVAPHVLRTLSYKESNGAREFCAMQDEAFLKSVGQLA